jgi:hypothetical protein
MGRWGNKSPGVICVVTNTYLSGRHRSVAKWGHFKEQVKGRPEMLPPARISKYFERYNGGVFNQVQRLLEYGNQRCLVSYHATWPVLRSLAASKPGGTERL